MMSSSTTIEKFIAPLIILVILKTIQFLSGCATFQDPRLYDSNRRESFLRNYEYYTSKEGLSKIIFMDAIGSHFIKLMKLPKEVTKNIDSLPYIIRIFKGISTIVLVFIGILTFLGNFPVLSQVGMKILGPFYTITRLIMLLFIVRGIFAVYYSKREITLFRETLDEETVMLLATVGGMGGDPLVQKLIGRLHEGTLSRLLLKLVKISMNGAFLQTQKLVNFEHAVSRSLQKYAETAADNIRYAYTFNRHGADIAALIIAVFSIISFSAPMYSSLFLPSDGEQISFQVVGAVIMMAVVTLAYTFVITVVWGLGRTKLVKMAQDAIPGTASSFFLSWLAYRSYSSTGPLETLEDIIKGWFRLFMRPSIPTWICAFLVVFIFMTWHEKKLVQKYADDQNIEEGEVYDVIPVASRITTYTHLVGVVFLLIAVVVAGVWLVAPWDVDGITKLMWNFLIILVAFTVVVVILLK